MSIGRRTPMLSTSSIRIFAISLLASFLPGVGAACWEDSDGFRTCNGLSKGAGIVIGVVTFIALIIFFLSMSTYCRRRHQRQVYLARVQQTQHGGTGAAYESPYGFAGAPPPFSPQYPPPAHSGLDSPYNYDPAAGFAPPSAPPQYYPPPPGVPPVTSQK